MVKFEKEQIGIKLRELRGNKSQREVAKALGLSPMAISMYETGKRIPDDHIKASLANFYGKSIDEIFFTN